MRVTRLFLVLVVAVGLFSYLRWVTKKVDNGYYWYIGNQCVTNGETVKCYNI